MDWGSIAIARPLWATSLALLGAFACAAACWRRRRLDAELARARATLLLALRVAFVALLATMFIEPRILREESHLPPVAAIVDDSLSMTRGVQGRPARDAALATVAALRELVDARAGRLDVWTLSSNELDAPPTLFSPIRSVVDADFSATSDVRYAKRFLFSDGIDNERTTPRSEASPLPFDAVAFGASQPGIDWRLTRATADYSRETNAARVTATIEFSGSSAPRVAALRLWTRATSTVVPRLVREERVELNPDSQFALDWTLQLTDGSAAEYLLHVADASDRYFETTDWLTCAPCEWRSEVEFALADNGAALSFLNDENEKTKVLLVDDEPSYEYRYLRELLRREDGVQLRALLFSADEDESETAFSQEEFERGEWESFDALILGELPPQIRANFVERLVTRRGERRDVSVWFFGDHTTPEALAVLFGVDATALDSDMNAEWRLAPTPSTPRLFPELKALWTDAATLARTAPTRVARLNVARADVEPLLAARNSATGETTPVLSAYERDDFKCVWQTIDEFWRFQTLDDKNVYRAFVLRALNYLTTRVESDAARASTAFDFFARPNENARQAQIVEEGTTTATCALLDELTSTCGGATLDLRDLARDAAVARARPFLEERLDALTRQRVVTRRPLIPREYGAPCALALLLGALGVETTMKRRTTRA